MSTELVDRAAADTALDGRVSTLEAVILEDNEFFTEKFAGDPAGNYIVGNAVQDNDADLVWVTVNGQDVSTHILSVSGTTVRLKDISFIGYAIDAQDEVVIRYQAL